MTTKEAIEILQQFNDWRRDKNDINQIEMPDVTQIGIAIDIAIEVMRAYD